MELDVASAVRNSLIVGACAAGLGFVPAVGMAWVLARLRFRGKALLTSIVTIPLVLPPVVTGLAIVALLGRHTPMGAAFDALGLPVTFTRFGAVLAALVVGFPIYVMTIRGAFEAVDPRYEEVAATLGSPPWRGFVDITLPLALPGIVAGVVLAFARGLGEFGATVVVAGNMEGSRTIALAVYALLDAPGEDARVTTLALAGLAVSIGALLGFEALNRWQRRRLDLDA